MLSKFCTLLLLLLLLLCRIKDQTKLFAFIEIQTLNFLSMKSLSGRNIFSFRFAGNNFSLFVPVLFAPGVLTDWQKGGINRNKPIIFHKVLTFSRDQLVFDRFLIASAQEQYKSFWYWIFIIEFWILGHWLLVLHWVLHTHTHMSWTKNF